MVAQIMQGLVPYVLILLFGPGLPLAFPQLALWLPSTMTEW